MDVTVFKLEIDDLTFNAPFGGRTRSDASSDTEPSKSGVKRAIGLGTVLVAIVLGGVVVLKRRFRGDDSENEPSPTVTEDEENGNRGAIRALIGLFFLILLSIATKRATDGTASVP